MMQPELTGHEPRATAVLPLFRPRVAWALLVINIVIYILPELVGLTPLVQDLGAKNNLAIQSGEYYRLITAMFLHASLTHIGFNAFALYSLGLDVERFYGSIRFLAIYFLAGIGGGIASYALSPNDSVGASGAIFGLVGALGAFFYSTRRLFGEISRQQIGSLIFITLINLGIGLTTPRIDNFAHMGGLVVGALAGLILAPQLSVDPWQNPPVIIRRSPSYAWPAAAALLAALILAALTIQPPIR